jgi:hypothetical protein
MLSQRIESVRRLSGKTVSLSLWIYASSAGLKVAASAFQNFGTGGSASVRTNLGGGAYATLLAGWNYVWYTDATLPSASGKTLGTAGTDYTQLEIWLSDQANQAGCTTGIGVQGSNTTIEIWGVQLEANATYTPFEHVDPRYDLANCQRFYQTVYLFSEPGAGSGVSVGTGAPINNMRAVPAGSVIANASVGLGTITLNTSAYLVWASATSDAAGPIMSVNTSLSADL